MLKRVIDQIHYEHFARLLQIYPIAQIAFWVLDQQGRCLWSNQKSNRLPRNAINKLLSESLRNSNDTEVDVGRMRLESGETLVTLRVHSPIQDGQLYLIAQPGQADEVQETDLVKLSEGMEAVGSCLLNEIQLNTELASVIDELVERYEELNLVYETDNQDSEIHNGQESLRRLVKSCTEFLDVGMSALILPDKQITLYDYNQINPVHNPTVLLNGLQRDLYTQLRSNAEAVVINTAKCAHIRNVNLDIPYKLIVTPVDSGDGQVIGMLVIVNLSWRPDFTNSDRNILDVMAKKVTKIVQANFDTLTGLENSNSFDWNLKAALTQAQRKGAIHTLLNINIDGTGIVNDISGRQAGDALIRQVGRKIAKMVRTRDLVARLSGDEFGVLLESCPLEIGTNLAQNLARGINEIHFTWEGRQHDVSACIGVAPVSAETESIAALMSSVEVARASAKERGRNHLQVYQQNDLELQRRREQIQWVGRVQGALRENRFLLYGQLIQDLRPGQDQSHFEVLLRMSDDQGQVVPPGVFLPAAERYHLMPGLDRWVIRSTFDRLLEFSTGPQTLPLRLSINLSGQSFAEDGFEQFVAEQLERLGDAKSNICFEITESSAIANLQEAIHFISQIKSMGCSFSLDDFGTGLSSFAYLKNLDVDFLKIDGSFVRHIETDPISQSMVSAINQVGHAMGLQTIAEFVENEGILQRLKSLEVDFAQGYGLGKPAPLMDCLTAYFKNRQSMTG